MPLSEAEITLLGELVGESYPDAALALSNALTGLSAEAAGAVETNLQGILTAYSEVKDKLHLRVSGGDDGVDLNYERKVGALRRRARVALKMSSASTVPVLFSLASGCRGA